MNIFTNLYNNVGKKKPNLNNFNIQEKIFDLENQNDYEYEFNKEIIVSPV